MRYSEFEVVRYSGAENVLRRRRSAIGRVRYRRFHCYSEFEVVRYSGAENVLRLRARTQVIEKVGYMHWVAKANTAAAKRQCRWVWRHAPPGKF